MSEITIEFPNDEIRDLFTGWFSDGGGESSFYASAEMEGAEIGVDYGRAFVERGYDPAKHGDPTIKVFYVEND